jgi:glycosyltransferase involved in cell wall biosynthesis
VNDDFAKLQLGRDWSSELMLRTSELKVAVVHDWAFRRRGGERVLENILKLVPNAKVFMLFGNPEYLRTSRAHTFSFTFLNSLPGVEKYYKFLLPLLPSAIESFDLSSFDLVISSSHCVAKGVVVAPWAQHICYIHSPMRYVWDQEWAYFPKPPTWKRPFEIARRLALSMLRVWDVVSANRVTHFVANSSFVADRVQFYYGRKASVVHPSVNTERFEKLRGGSLAQNNTERKALLFGAWVPYKRMEETLYELVRAGIPVVAAGSGDNFEATKRRFLKSVGSAGWVDLSSLGQSKAPNVEWVSNPSDAEVENLFAGAHCFVLPGVEDFGMVVVEALAAGMHAVVPNRGGAAGIPGVKTFELGKPGALVAAVEEALKAPLVEEQIAKNRVNMRNFGETAFLENFAREVLNTLDGKVQA